MNEDNDIGLIFDCDSLIFDLALNASKEDLQGAINLENSILISLFTDRRTDDSDEITNSRGWAGDAIADETTPLIGSKLWQFQRAKTTDNRLIQAVDFAREALQWLIDDKIVASFNISADYKTKQKGALVLTIDATRPEDENLRFQFEWDQVRNQLTSTSNNG